MNLKDFVSANKFHKTITTLKLQLDPILQCMLLKKQKYELGIKDSISNGR